MVRPRRVAFHGAWYHVMNRGAAHGTVFRDPLDARDFVDLLQELADRSRIETHAYCLMGNHYHLLVYADESSLSEAARHLDAAFGQRLSRRRSTAGPVFPERFRAVRVQADRHLACTSRYIHLNPVMAGLTPRADQWDQSSYRVYLGQVPSPAWLHTGTILGWFGSTGARRRYREFVEAGLDRGTRDRYGRGSIRPVLGDEWFVERLRAEIDAPDARPIALEEVAREIEAAFGIAPGSLACGGPGKRRANVLARGAFVYAARRVGARRLVEIAAWLGYAGYAGAARAAAGYRAAALADPALAERLRTALAALGRAASERRLDRLSWPGC